jgi:hypothetical protein
VVIGYDPDALTWPHAVAPVWRELYEPAPQSPAIFCGRIVHSMEKLHARCDPCAPLPELLDAFERKLHSLFDEEEAAARIATNRVLRRFRKVASIAQSAGVARGRVTIFCGGLQVWCADDEAVEKLRARLPDSDVDCAPEMFAAPPPN